MVSSFLFLADTISLTLEDVGCRVRVAYIPVRGDGVQGDELTATTDIVVEGETRNK
jgi:hypothetical protein